MRKPCFTSFPLLLAMVPAVLATDNSIDALTQTVERDQMQRLAAQQHRPGIIIKRFNSDGCSGGMSQTWEFIADRLPLFAEYAGKLPPWEHCCVAHDRDYWNGETRDGFARRAESDARLRSCVRATGEQRSAEISKNLGLPEDDIIDIINLTADLMYQTVRISGLPCTELDWRWGHGWPNCSEALEPGNQI